MNWPKSDERNVSSSNWCTSIWKCKAARYKGLVMSTWYKRLIPHSGCVEAADLHHLEAAMADTADNVSIIVLMF